MKRLIFIMTTCIMIYSCTESTKPNNKYLTDYEYKTQRDLILDSLKSKNDTIILDFIFGMSNNSYNNRILKLIADKKLGQKSEIKINIGNQYSTVDGYSYDFYLSSKKYNSLLKGDFHNSKLNRFNIILYNVDTYADDMLVSMYNTKYGDFLREKKESGSVIYFWIINNLEIKIEYFIPQSLIIITYNDLIVERKIEKIQKIEDLSKDAQNDI